MELTESEMLALAHSQIDRAQTSLIASSPADAAAAIGHLERALEWLRRVQKEQETEQRRARNRIYVKPGISGANQWMGGV